MDNETVSTIFTILKNHAYPHADVKDLCAAYIVQDPDGFTDLDGNRIFAEDVYEAALAGRLKLVTMADDCVVVSTPHIAVDDAGYIGLAYNPSDPVMWIDKRTDHEDEFTGDVN